MINFLKYKWLYFLISAVVIGSGIFSIIKWGYKYSIDFVGGTNLEYSFDQTVDKKKLLEVFKNEKIEVISLSLTGKNLTAKTKAIDEVQEKRLENQILSTFKTKLTLLKFETVGPSMGKETMNKTLLAALVAVIGILIYMSYAFKGFNFAFAAVIANVHDLLVILGSYSLMSHFLGAEVDTMFVTAVLTTMSFSLHDTIVIFDKIREYHKESGQGNIEYYANKALTETMVRSVNNSMTIIFMLLALTLMGGNTIRFFVATLLIGTITGTYSSPFVATPILVFLAQRQRKK
jgi:preprotein translocase subunit SecF